MGPLFATAVSSLVGGGVPSMTNPMSSLGGGEKETSSKADVSGATTVSATMGTKMISFGGESTNWMIILGVVAVIFFLSRR